MAKIIELHKSRPLFTGPSGAGIELHYWISGTTNETIALRRLKERSRPYYTIDDERLIRHDFNLEPVGEDTWLGAVSYTREIFYAEPPKDVGEAYHHFAILTETRATTHSIATTDKIPGDAPDFGGAINVEKDADKIVVNGLDILFPVHRFDETHYFASTTVTTAYKKIIAGLAGRFNDAEFRGYDPGEVLFLGAEGSKRGDTSRTWEINYQFAVIFNEPELTINGLAGDLNKRGWDYVWINYGQEVDADTMVKKPKSAYVEQVYKPGDFSTLGLGTGPE